MDYAEELPENDGEVVSDEDEDIDGAGPIEGLPGDTDMDIEVLIDGDEDDDEDEEDDDEDEDDEDEDGSSGMDDEIIAGEITGDNDNDSLEGGEEDTWESEDMSDEHDAVEMMNQLENELDEMGQGHRDQPRFDNLLRVLEEAGGTVEGFESGMLGRDPEGDDMDDDDEMNEGEGEN
jgi:E3 ubiquitin-protein ligase HUWE1